MVLNKEGIAMLRQIKYFQAVVKHNSFSEAAYECNISQSAISQQVQALERELDFSLLERKNHKFELTPAGEYFYKKSLVLLADYEQIARESTRFSGGSYEHLKVGFFKVLQWAGVSSCTGGICRKVPGHPGGSFYGNHNEL